MSVPKSDALGQEHAQMRQQARQSRRDPVAFTLGKVIMAAVKEAEDMRKLGCDAAQVATGLEATVREHWPKGREREWKELCGECHDYGWRVSDCPGDATCGRPRRHLAHDYVRPCWCAKGRTVMPPEKTPDDFTAAGRTPRKRQPARFGS